MNSLTSNPAAAQTLAAQMIAERVRDAEQRRTARALRDQRRAARRASRVTTTAQPMPWLTRRFLRPAH
jgi:hypothetical protein